MIVNGSTKILTTAKSLTTEAITLDSIPYKGNNMAFGFRFYNVADANAATEEEKYVQVLATNGTVDSALTHAFKKTVLQHAGNPKQAAPGHFEILTEPVSAITCTPGTGGSAIVGATHWDVFVIFLDPESD